MANDSFARGAKSISAPTGGHSMSQIAWDAIFLDAEKFQDAYGMTKEEYRAAQNPDVQSPV
jgi:hypothetical protein